MISAHPSHGFTLIEILIAMAISTMALWWITTFTLDIAGFGVTYNKSLTALQETNITTKILRSELLAASQSVQGAYPIAAVSSQSLTFFSDINADNSAEQVRYFLNGTTLQKGIIVPSGNPLIYDAASEIVTDAIHAVVASAGTALFSYYDNSYTGSQPPLTYPIDPSKIRLIRAQITTDDDPLQVPGPLTSVLFVTVRNLRTSP